MIHLLLYGFIKYIWDYTCAMEDKCIESALTVRPRQLGISCDSWDIWQHRACNSGKRVSIISFDIYISNNFKYSYTYLYSLCSKLIQKSTICTNLLQVCPLAITNEHARESLCNLYAETVLLCTPVDSIRRRLSFL